MEEELSSMIIKFKTGESDFVFAGDLYKRGMKLVLETVSINLFYL